jgi:2-polyprenyl-3-methyl-5-hydroxy-6-metoxy-1,4-benzoquinol methylase
MAETAPAPKRLCWCGGGRLAPFNEDYLTCTGCGTLVSQAGLSAEQTQVGSDDRDYYGKEYWFSHQSADLGLPDIRQRARQDLPERCLHWLRTLLSFKLPPARVLELGCSHGGFVALLRWAGFDACGQEVSPWVVDYARKTFDAPMILGTIEEQPLPERPFDAVVLNDVLEHLPDPVGTMRRCAELLKPDGMLLMQTPDYPDEQTFAAMRAGRMPFLVYLENKGVTVEHLYVFSKRSARALCERLGCGCVQFEPPMFPCDMFFAAGRQPLGRTTAEQVDRALEASPSGRLVQALLHAQGEVKRVQGLWQYDHDLAQEQLRTLHARLAEAQNAHAQAAARLASFEELGPVVLGVARKVRGVSRRIRRVPSLVKGMFRKAG